MLVNCLTVNLPPCPSTKKSGNPTRLLNRYQALGSFLAKAYGTVEPRRREDIYLCVMADCDKGHIRHFPTYSNELTNNKIRPGGGSVSITRLLKNLWFFVRNYWYLCRMRLLGGNSWVMVHARSLGIDTTILNSDGRRAEPWLSAERWAPSTKYCGLNFVNARESSMALDFALGL